MTFYTWSETADNNQTADPTINWREGQAPRSLNNSARAIMAAAAKFRDDQAGNLLTTGTASAYLLTSNQGLVSLVDGFSISFMPHVTNATPCTISVDEQTFKPLRMASGTECFESLLGQGAIYKATYNDANGEWVLSGIFNPIPFVSQTPTGVTADFVGATAPSGWILLSGLTIGDASSSATGRANADTAALYSLLWGAMSNTVCPVAGGRGVDAATDFANHKAMGLPDCSGCVRVGKDDMSGTARGKITSAGSGISGTTLGASGGVETVTLLLANMASHDHGGTTGNAGAHSHTVPGAGFVNVSYSGGGGSAMRNTGGDLTTSTAADHAHSITAAGGGQAHQNTQPSIVMNVIVKL